MIKCKNALAQFDNDVKQAEKWLRDQAKKEGWAKATKLQDRAATQGSVGIIQRNNSSFMLEINCETDFVAKNANFVELLKSSTLACLQHCNDKDQSSLLLSKDEIQGFSTSKDSTIADSVALQIGNLGENISIRRGAYLKHSKSQFIGCYAHNPGQEHTISTEFIHGKYGAIILCENQIINNHNKEFQFQLGRQLAQHVVGMNPLTISCTQTENEETDPETLKDLQDKAMVHQEFLLDPSITVSELLIAKGLQIINYFRYECGEEIGETET